MKKNTPQSKTRYTAFVATSIDGRISLSNKNLPDWTSKEDRRFFQKSLTNIEAVVVGRNTYNLAAEKLNKRNTFVLSSRPKTIKCMGTVTFVNPAKTNLAVLLQKYRTVAVLGGGSVYRFMLENKMLDEIFVTIEPLIFGRGKEMFIKGTKTTKLELLSVKKLNHTGTLLLHYKIIKK